MVKNRLGLRNKTNKGETMTGMLKEINGRIKKSCNKEIARRELEKKNDIQQGDWVELVNPRNVEPRRGKHLVVGFSKTFVYVIKQGFLFENPKNEVRGVPREEIIR